MTYPLIYAAVCSVYVVPTLYISKGVTYNSTPYIIIIFKKEFKKKIRILIIKIRLVQIYNIFKYFPSIPIV